MTENMMLIVWIKVMHSSGPRKMAGESITIDPKNTYSISMQLASNIDDQQRRKKQAHGDL